MIDLLLELRVYEELGKEIEDWNLLGYVAKFVKGVNTYECVLLPKWEQNGDPIHGGVERIPDAPEHELKLLSILLAGYGAEYLAYELKRRKLSFLVSKYL